MTAIAELSPRVAVAAAEAPPDERVGDRVAILEARQGDRASMQAIYEAEAPRLLRRLRHLTGDLGYAQDLTHDAFVVAFGGSAAFDGTASLSTWLYGIAINKWRNEQRKSKRRWALLAARVAPRERGREASEAVEVDDLQRRFDAALAELAPPLREAFVLRVIEGLPLHEAAQLAGERNPQCPSGPARPKPEFERRSNRSTNPGAEMNSYERALSVARSTPMAAPEFEAVAAACDTERERWTEEDRDRRERAQRWLLFAAAVWLTFPLLYAFLPDAFIPARTVREIFALYFWYVPMVPILLWAARLSGDRRFRANIFTRAIATSNLVLALLFSFCEVNSLCVFSILLAVASCRTLQLLGERGLDGSEDHRSNFEPIRFRGILILTLLLACADVGSLLFMTASVASGATASYFVEGFGSWPAMLLGIGLTASVAVLMTVNIWGLLRLRTWALFSGMLANIGVAILGWSGFLLGGYWTAAALTTTGAIQLLLPLPIFAAALGLGRDRSRQYAWVGAALLWVVVPVAALVVIGVAILHLRWSIPDPLVFF